MSVKECAVCGGHVRPLDDRSGFGSCDKCGVVYALGDRVKAGWVTEPPGGREEGSRSEPAGIVQPARAYAGDATAVGRTPGSYWRCPDCDTEIRADNDSDLGFAKREHIREYHPNRAGG